MGRLGKKLKKFEKTIDNNNIDELYDVCMCECEETRVRHSRKISNIFTVIYAVIWNLTCCIMMVIAMADDDQLFGRDDRDELTCLAGAAAFALCLLSFIMRIIVNAITNPAVRKTDVDIVEKLKYIDNTLYSNLGDIGKINTNFDLLMRLVITLPVFLIIVRSTCRMGMYNLIGMHNLIGFLISLIAEGVVVCIIFVLYWVGLAFRGRDERSLKCLKFLCDKAVLENFNSYASKYGEYKPSEKCEQWIKQREEEKRVVGYSRYSSYSASSGLSGPYYKSQYNKYMNQFGGSSGSRTSGSGSSSMHDELDALHRSLYEHHPDDWSAPPPPWKDY